MNSIYRKILMITGPVPDIYRDYDFDELIPEVLDEMQRQSDILENISKILEENTGEKGQHVVLLDKIALQLEQMAKRPERIASRFNSYKGNIGALGTWILNTRHQPLELDYILITPSDGKIPKAEAGFFANTIYHIKAFIMSFFKDYTSVGVTDNELLKNTDEDNEITVWINSAIDPVQAVRFSAGRDQAQIIRQMIDDTFTPETNIQVNLLLVSQGTLLPSTLAGIGPDIALSNMTADPVNFAIRNAAVDVSEFSNYSEVAQRFHPSALVPFTLEGKVYALPETQIFPMFFYRKDIFLELGFKVPKTWDDFYSLIPLMQKRNMEIAFQPGYLGMLVFLYQDGGQLYKNNGARSNLDSDKSIEAFGRMCELYTLYKLPVAFEFANRFRTGEMPAGIADFTLYNQLTVFAPEIRGLWEFVKLPGTMNDDGSINNASPATGTAIMMLRGTKSKENAWEFMEWWTSAKTQERYGIELESLVGPAAKHPTANMDALSKMPWPTSAYKNLMNQWEHVVGIPEVPGGYYTPRNVDFAFRRVYNDGDEPAEVILEYIKEINTELKRKRQEFGLE